MEMTYDGALIMPSSYAVMNEEEMMYVEGGGIGKHWYNKKKFVVNALDAAVTIATGVSGALSAARAAKILKSSVLRGKLTKAAANKLAGYIGGAFTKLFASALSVISIVSGITLGNMIYSALDRIDGKRGDGYFYA